MFDSKKEYVQVGSTENGNPIFMLKTTKKKEDKKMEKAMKVNNGKLKRAGKWIAAGIGAVLAVAGTVLLNAAKKKDEGLPEGGNTGATIDVPVSAEGDSVIDIVPPDQNGSEEDTSET